MGEKLNQDALVNELAKITPAFGHEFGVQFFHDEAGECGTATAQFTCVAYALAEQTNEGF